MAEPAHPPSPGRSQPDVSAARRAEAGKRRADASSAKVALPEGLILAGGQSRRMGGRDKGLLLLQGQALVQHVLQRIAPQTAGVAINANRHADAYRIHGEVVSDAIDLPAGGGPLVGVASGLRRCRTEWLLCVPCDTPWLPDDLVRRLQQAVTSAGVLASVVRTPVRRHPVCLLLHRTLEPGLAAWLQSGGRKVGMWLDTLPVAEAWFDDDSRFANLNAPDELAAAERRPVLQCNQSPNG